ncbi:hypothetical protein BDR22DRAFT_360437 [Usnea florida]
MIVYNLTLLCLLSRGFLSYLSFTDGRYVTQHIELIEKEPPGDLKPFFCFPDEHVYTWPRKTPFKVVGAGRRRQGVLYSQFQHLCVVHARRVARRVLSALLLYLKYSARKRTACCKRVKRGQLKASSSSYGERYLAGDGGQSAE